MIETLFGPPIGLTFPTPMPFANGPIGTPLFGPSMVPGMSGGLTAAPAAPMPTPMPAGAYGIAAPALLAAVAIRRGQPQGPANDQDVEDFIYDALELVSGAVDVEVRCEGARVTLTGSVPHKRIKHDVGEIGWAIPALQDVQNNITIAPRRRGRPSREAETPPSPPRKQT